MFYLLTSLAFFDRLSIDFDHLRLDPPILITPAFLIENPSVDTVYTVFLRLVSCSLRLKITEKKLLYLYSKQNTLTSKKTQPELQTKSKKKKMGRINARTYPINDKEFLFEVQGILL